MLLERLVPAPDLRPTFNLGCLFDIPTGKYYTGTDGESILNGGLTYITGIGGRGNSFKSAIGDWFLLKVLSRYKSSNATVYDTEISKNILRYYELAKSIPELSNKLLQDDGRLVLSDCVTYTGNQYYDLIKEIFSEKSKDKANILTTPFMIATTSEPILSFLPTASFIDSFSQFKTDSVIKIQESADIGESGRNVEALKDGAAKTQMMVELGRLGASSGGLFILTAHMGDDFSIDPRSFPKKKLAFLKNGVKFKNVPEKFTFLTNNCWYVLDSKALLDDNTKTPAYPRNSEDDMRNDTDLMICTLVSLRCKSGPTGIPFEIIISQSEGVKVGLSEFKYIYSNDRFGIFGSKNNYSLDLLPEVSLSRTTVRSKIDNNLQLQRVLEITSELCQMFEYWHDLPKDLLCTPATLYTDLVNKGYDWNRLLNTRGYWIFKEDDDGSYLPFLSTMDLLNMRTGGYHPKWYGQIK